MSTTFKYKPKKIYKGPVAITLDIKHTNAVKKFENDEIELPQKKKILKKYKKELKEIEKMPRSEYTEQTIERKTKLKDLIENLKNEIEHIENHQDEMEYYSKNGNLISSYYEIVGHNKGMEGGENHKKKSNKTHQKKKTQLEQLYENSQKNKPRKPNTRRLIVKNASCSSILSFCQDQPKEKNKGKKEEVDRYVLLDTYMINTDPLYISKNKFKKNINICDTCGEERVLHSADSLYICPQCGNAIPLLIESENPSYRDQMQENTGYPYKRTNHLNEILSQFQANESTEIPEDVYKQIIDELKKRRIVNSHGYITDPNDLDYKLMKNILKNRRLNRYYEHIPHIINKISGLLPPTLSRVVIAKVRAMFKAAQKPFNKYKPKNRKNFLNYNYTLKKIFEILEMPQIARHFPPLKSKEKLILQDKVWKKICQDCKWKFYPSI